MKASIRSLFITALFLAMLLLTGVASANLKTGNQYVTGEVEDGTGFVTFFTSPGNPPNGDFLSFRDKSFFTAVVGNKYYTNNPYITKPSSFAANLTDGVLSKIGDTITCTWSSKNGVDLIQEIYPVAFTHSGQIVIRWKVHNPAGSPVGVQIQYLLDDEVSNNDRAIILTKYGYNRNWNQFSAGNPGIPPFFIAFQNDLPTANPGIDGTGYFDNAVLQLKIPTRITTGHWDDMVQQLWGPSLLAGPYDDSAILYEWAGVSATPKATVEIARTSYGTGEFDRCSGNLFALIFYPHTLLYDPLAIKYIPNPFPVSVYVFNTDVNSTVTQTKMNLSVGPYLTIVGPVGNIPPGGKTDTLSLGTIQVQNVVVADWTVQADLYTNCSADTNTYISLNGTSSKGPPTFANPCDLPVTLPCTDHDIQPPIVDAQAASDSSSIKAPFFQQFNVHDDRAKDLGIQSITFAYTGPNQTKFTVTTSPPLVGPCNKLPHVVKVVQNDSTIGGCFDFTFTDCAGNKSYKTICFVPHTVAATPDNTAPHYTLISRTGAFDPNIICNSRIDSLIVKEDSPNDKGLDSLVVVTATNMTLNTLPVTRYELQHKFALQVIDSMLDGCITVRAKDVAGNFRDTSYCYCTMPDTNLPVVKVGNIVNGVWHITVTDNQPWDRLLDSVVIAIQSVPGNITTSIPTAWPAALKKGLFEFDVITTDTLLTSAFCIYATDLAGHKSPLDCQHNPPKPDIWTPNINVTNINPARIAVDVNDVHYYGPDTTKDLIGWDSGIDSVWFTNYPPSVINVPATIHANFAHVVPTFQINVIDTTKIDSNACVTINANDKRTTNVATWCYQFSNDILPPSILSTGTTRTILDMSVSDTTNTDRGLRRIQLINAVNFNPLDMTLTNQEKQVKVSLQVTTPGQSSIGTLTAIDIVGDMSGTLSTKAQHTTSANVAIWAQDLGMPKSVSMRSTGTGLPVDMMVPVRCMPNDTFTLARKGITSVSFSFQFSAGSDPGITFKNIDLTNTSCLGWTPTMNTVGGVTTVTLTSPSPAVVLTDTSKPLVNLVFSAIQSEKLTSAIVKITPDGSGNTVVYNQGNATTTTGTHTLVNLPAPYGNLTGTNIVVIGSCNPSIGSGVTPTSVSLMPNNPNPFTKMTTLTYTVAQEGIVTLVIFDAMGREVSRIVSQEQKPGQYSVKFDAANTAPGSYYVRLETGGKVISRMMVISK
jgi:hypothetical protein